MKLDNIVDVIENKKITENFYLMSFLWNGTEPLPGQFVNISVPGKFLKRPFTVFNYENNVLSILYKVVGEGTKIMSDWQTGLKTECLGPLGKPFALDNNITVMVGGGTGIASLYYLSNKIEGEKYIFLGFSSSDESRYFYEIFSKNGSEIFISSMDGGYGFKGNVIELLEKEIDNIKGKKTIYSCGPHKMLASLYRFEKYYDIEKIWVSLEERMGCGFGACLGCAVQTKDNNFKYVCKDGPAFLLSDIVL